MPSSADAARAAVRAPSGRSRRTRRAADDRRPRRRRAVRRQRRQPAAGRASTETVEALVAPRVGDRRAPHRDADARRARRRRPPTADGGEASDDQGARRFARLLVSEIKLYNEAAVRTGRQQRDLLQRLRVEIDRAQRLYEERVPPAVGGRHAYFQQELVQTLADGDPALLGSQ